MATPSPELIQALNNMRDEFMRLHAAFYAGSLGADEQTELAKHCTDMIEHTSHIGKGTVRPVPQAVYTRIDELDPDEKTYIERIQSSKQQGMDIDSIFNTQLKNKIDKIGKGKILKEGDKF